MPYKYRKKYSKKAGNGPSQNTSGNLYTKTQRKHSTGPIIRVFHTSSKTSTPTPPGTSSGSSSSPQVPQLNPDQQQVVREAYKLCLANAAQSGKCLTSLQRQSLRTAISMEAQLQPPSGPTASSQQSGSPPSQSPSMTTEELVSLLQQRLSISASALPPKFPSPATVTSA